MAKKEVKDILQYLEKGVSNLFESDMYRAYIESLSKFHSYSANNIFWIMVQNPDFTRVASFKTWNDLGRMVKKGEKGLQILVPRFYKYFYTSENKKKFYNQATTRELDLIAKGEIKLYQGTYFDIGYVFDISQTEGDPLPSITNELMGENDISFYIVDTLSRVLSKEGYQVQYEQMGGSQKGYIDYSKKVVGIKDTAKMDQKAKTVIHEYAHKLLHEGTGKSRNEKEVEAESVAFAVASYLKLDTSEYSFGYIAGWSKDKELKELKQSLELIQKTANKIIEIIEKDYQDTRKEMEEMGIA